MLSQRLAELYSAPAKVLNQAVRLPCQGGMRAAIPPGETPGSMAGKLTAGTWCVPSPIAALTEFLTVLDCGRGNERMMHSPSELTICGEHYERQSP
jgi:hypothetical protein